MLRITDFRTFCRVAVALLCSGLIGTSALVCSAAPIRIAGSSTVHPIVEQAVKVYQETHPEARFIVGAGGSSRGIQRVGDGEVELGMASRALKDKEKTKYPQLEPCQIARDGIVIIVHATNPVQQITRQQVRDIFTGKITNWRELGGDDAPINVVSTNQRHGTFGAFNEHFDLEARAEGTEGSTQYLFFKETEEPAYSSHQVQAVDGNKPVLAAVVTKPNGVSYASLGSALRVIERGVPVKMLSLDGVAPSEAAVLDGSYPVQRPLILLTNGKPEGEVKDFLGFLLGPKGQAIVEAMDCIPTTPRK